MFLPHVFTFDLPRRRRSSGARPSSAGAHPAPEAGPRCAILEFVRGDDPEAFREDAAILIGLLNDTADTKIKNPVGG